MSHEMFNPGRRPLQQVSNQAGEQVWARELDFITPVEPSTSYKFLDGGEVRMRLIVRRIFEVTDAEGVPQYNPDGTRSLLVQSQTDIMSI